MILCENCFNKAICKFSKDMEAIKGKVDEIDTTPFIPISIEVRCNYYKIKDLNHQSFIDTLYNNQTYFNKGENQ